MIVNDLIQVSNKTHLNHTDMRIFSVLSQLSTYSSWWPQAKITYINDTSVNVSPLGPGSFIWTMGDTIENKSIVLLYDGIFSGQGIWTIENDGAMTYLTYSVSLVIENKLFKFINKFVPIARLHSKIMEKVFLKLDFYLNNNHQMS